MSRQDITVPDGGGHQSKTVKCLVWDLDNTIWNGILLEDGQVTLREPVVDVLRTLDERGILHSIASRNDPEAALAALCRFGIADYFLYPQIHWGSKAGSVDFIAKALNIGLDSIAFVDDQPFEREEVAFAHPVVRCIDALDLERILDRHDMLPEFITDDSRQRRAMYMADAHRKQLEDSHQGSPTEFLASLAMNFVISRAQEEDLARAEELTLRTNQLNATGYTYSYEELRAFQRSPDHDLWVATLDDKYGTYGKIGLALIERCAQAWTIKLLLMSCRVMSRGVGTVLLNSIIRRASDAGVRLLAEFVETGRNRMMNVTYRFAGFKPVEQRGSVTLLENDFSAIQNFPEYMQVRICDGVSS